MTNADKIRAITDEDSTIDAIAQKIYAALDALDRGADNDWARAALEEANQILDAYYKEVPDNDQR
jgi:hypothetical protein